MDKHQKYQQVIKQIHSLTEGESDLIANLSNIVALLHHEFQFWWTGFYFVKNHELVLGPFQGPIACTRIPHGRGVCGTAWKQKKTFVIDDVHQFPGHIACSAESNSEIVVPIIFENNVIAILDIDSKDFQAFDSIDKKNLEKICTHLSTLFT